MGRTRAGAEARVGVGIVAAVLGFVSPPAPAAPVSPPVAAVRTTSPADRLVALAREDDRTMADLEALCDDIGARLAGSPALTRATAWAEERLRAEGLSNVRRQPVTVPVWTRGRERLTLLAPQERDLPMLGLGGSVGTAGVEASVVVVRDWIELGPHVSGRIVLYNKPMAGGVPALARYADAVEYRENGASRAAAHGAVGCLVRSVTTRSLATPHTGALQYHPALPRIPAAAVTLEDADWIERQTRRGADVRVRLEMGAQTHPDAESHNVIGEIPGAERPDEIVLVGAHLDSWDVGQGASDDGAGVAQVIAVMRALRELGTAPARTVRAVLFTNEENGMRGGLEYAREHARDRHVAAVESDLGGLPPLAWSAGGSRADMAWLRALAAPLGMPVLDGGGGTDIWPLQRDGVLAIGLRTDDAAYFDTQHTAADTLDKIDPAHLREGAAVLASLVWRLANDDRTE